MDENNNKNLENNFNPNEHIENNVEPAAPANLHDSVEPAPPTMDVQDNVEPVSPLDIQGNNTETINNNIQPENAEPKAKEEKSNFYWIIYIAIVIIIFIIIFLLLKGCNGAKTKNQNKIVEANDWVTNIWNKCVDPVYWYTVDGTGVNGASIDIDSVLKDCDTYYNEYQQRKTEITSLSDDYKDFKDIYSKIIEQVEIIYPKIKASKPVAEEFVDYEDNMEILYEQQMNLYNLVKEKYSEG